VVETIGKGGQSREAQVSPDLYAAIAEHLATAGEPLADLRGYQAAWRRAIEAVHGQVTGTHGLRRLSSQQYYAKTYAKMRAAGLSSAEARCTARQEAVSLLGHSKTRTDQAACYLGAA